mmetsp:Transcript_16461/g.45402  ORF Transcript_16461/g.45402 Transcript_16461/m.45402 type:complete len:179 (+) Transcript_16461:664-1200(+)
MPLDRIALTDAENKALEEISLNEESAPIGRSFLAWRRRLLFMSVFLYAIDLAIQIYTWFMEYYLYEDHPPCVYDTELGVAALSSETLAKACPLIVVFMGAFVWTDYRKSRAKLLPGMLLQLFLVNEASSGSSRLALRQLGGRRQGFFGLAFFLVDYTGLFVSSQRHIRGFYKSIFVCA